MTPTTSVRIVIMRDGVDHSVDSARKPITSASNPSLGRVSACTPISAVSTGRHGANIQIPGTKP